MQKPGIASNWTSKHFTLVYSKFYSGLFREQRNNPLDRYQTTSSKPCKKRHLKMNGTIVSSKCAAYLPVFLYGKNCFSCKTIFKSNQKNNDDFSEDLVTVQERHILSTKNIMSTCQMFFSPILWIWIVMEKLWLALSHAKKECTLTHMIEGADRNI